MKMASLSSGRMYRLLGQLAILTAATSWGWVSAQQPTKERSDKPSTELAAPVAQLAEPQTREIGCPPNLKERLKPLNQIRADIRLSPGPRPMDCTDPIFSVEGTAEPRERCATEFRWCPTNFHLTPPYFEDTPLERYGQSACPILQPAISTAHFFCVLSTLPYRMLVDRPCEPIYTLGYYRPGSPTPCVRQTLPCPRERP